MICLDVAELLGVDNVLTVVGKERRYRGDDAGTIWAGKREDELMVGHGAVSTIPNVAAEAGFAALLYHRQRLRANPNAIAFSSKPGSDSIGTEKALGSG